MTVDELKELRSTSYCLMRKYKLRMDACYEAYLAMRADYERYSLQWTNADHELALQDGRLTIVTTSTPKNRRKSDKEEVRLDIENLTEEQVDFLLKELNVEVPKVEDVTEDDLLENVEDESYHLSIEGEN
jgi:hypothetical protein